jgi:pilus assembly protein CpaE
MEPVTAALVIKTQALWDEARPVLDKINARVLMERTEIGDWTNFLDQIERLAPDAVFLDLADLKEPAEQVIRRIKATSVSPAVIALHTEADPNRILAAMRAGAFEFLFPPLAQGIGSVCARIVGGRPDEVRPFRPGGKVFGFFSAKGGCGATTLVCHLALEARRLTGSDTLVLDLDLDAGIIGFLMKAKSNYTVLDAAQNVHRLDASFWNALVSNGRPGIKIIKAPDTTAARERPKPEALRHILRFARNQYATSIVDLGRSLNPTLMNALEELDQAFLVTTLEVPALHHAKQIIQKLESAGYQKDRLRLLVNRFPKRPEITVEEIGKSMGLPVYQAIPNDYLALYNAYAEGALLTPDHQLMRHFGRLASKILGIEDKDKKSKFKLW